MASGSDPVAVSAVVLVATHELRIVVEQGRGVRLAHLGSHERHDGLLMNSKLGCIFLLPVFLVALGCGGSEPNGPGGNAGSGAGGNDGGTGGTGGDDPQCETSSFCPGGAPICLNGRCEPCTASTACALRNADTPVCATDGRCVECSDHEDCQSDVCDRDNNVCVPESDIVFVRAGDDEADPPDPGGTDASGCGLRQQPCASIGYAVENRIDNGVGREWIRTTAGQYLENLDLEGESIRIVGEDGVVIFGDLAVDATTMRLRANASLHLDRVEMGIGIVNLLCTGEPDARASMRVERSLLLGSRNGFESLRSSACDVWLTDTTIRRSDEDAIVLERDSTLVFVGGIVAESRGLALSADGGSVQIERVLFFDNCQGGITLNRTDFTIRNNVIAFNGDDTDAGACAPSGFGGIRIQNDGPNVREFSFNTVVGNRKQENIGGASGVLCQTSAPIDIENSIIWDNTKGMATDDVQVSGFCEVSYSNVQGGVIGAPMLPGLIAGDGIIDTTPLFVDPFRYDYHLTPESPAKDAANPEATLTIDFDGNERPIDGRHDMGAFEVQ